MEAVIVAVALFAIIALADRFSDSTRPVLRSNAYREALTGMIREPRAQAVTVTVVDTAPKAEPLEGTRSASVRDRVATDLAARSH